MAKNRKFTQNDRAKAQAESTLPFPIAPLAEEDQKLKRRGFIPLMVEGHGKDPIVGRVATYKGKTRVSLRFHYRQGNLLRPTKRGIEIPLEDAEEVRDLLNEILAQVEREKAQ